MSLLLSEPYVPQLVTARNLRKGDVMMIPKDILSDKVEASTPLGDSKNKNTSEIIFKGKTVI